MSPTEPTWWSEEDEAALQEALAERKRLRQNVGILEAQLRKSRDALRRVSERTDELERRKHGEVELPLEGGPDGPGQEAH